MKKDHGNDRAEYLEYMWRAYQEIYVQSGITGATRRILVSPMDAYLHEIFASRRIGADTGLESGTYSIGNRVEQYSLATQLLGKSKISIQAIDTTSPVEWQDEKFMQEYLASNASSPASKKQRVHVFNRNDLTVSNNLAKNKNSYRTYIDVMKAAGFNDLKFLEKSDADGLINDREGVVIIDDEVAFQTDRDQGEKASLAVGEVRVMGLDQLRGKFRRAFTDEKAMTPDDFAKEFLQMEDL